MIPLFPELRPHLLEVFDQAGEGTDYVISRYRDGACNLRTQLCRIIRKAGLRPWRKPWHNLRSTRQTELAERFPIHAVCNWMGNSRAVAQEDYLQVTDAHFAQAVQEPPTANRQKPDGGAAQNPAQQAAEPPRTEPQTVGAGCETLGFSERNCTVRNAARRQVPATGFEPVTCGLGNRRSIRLSYAGISGGIVACGRKGR